eukprot:TRINITY_DN1149_c0_g1_i4.p1 TRINITY_DN1149_c0_g1~~TRINITY_DN1149_c0_g1_i4.p1  ORF type:complete len:286 (-),score=41.89 TRINITY_DN1149_c0_g1_i4:163-1020(-)
MSHQSDGQPTLVDLLRHGGNHYATQARALIEAGTDVNAKVGDKTPLMVAFCNHPSLVQLLIDHGADLNVQVTCQQSIYHQHLDCTGCTPLLSAIYESQTDLIAKYVARGADVVNFASKDGRTPLMIALQNGLIDVAKLLIENGADMTTRNPQLPVYGMTEGDAPLLTVIRLKHTTLVPLCIEKGADVNVVSKDGVTPLLLASQLCMVDEARLLIENGADMTVQNRDGDTPLLALIRLKHSASRRAPTSTWCHLDSPLHREGRRRQRGLKGWRHAVDAGVTVGYDR